MLEFGYYNNGNGFVGFEKDEKMHQLSMKRYTEETAQIRLDV